MANSECTIKIDMDAVMERIERLTSKAIRDVVSERLRQIEAEGWNSHHDDEHTDRSLAIVAACYAANSAEHAFIIEELGEEGITAYQQRGIPHEWPASWSPEYWKPKNPRRDLVRAAALIIAEIDRLDRAEQKKGGAS